MNLITARLIEQDKNELIETFGSVTNAIRCLVLICDDLDIDVNHYIAEASKKYCKHRLK